MSSNTEETVNIQQEVLTRFDQLVDQMKDVSDQYGPQAIEAVTTALYVDAVMNIVAGLILCAITGYIFYKGSKGIKWGLDNSRREEAGFFMFLSCVVMAVTSIFFALSLFDMVLDKASWTMLISPEAGVARHIIGL